MKSATPALCLMIVICFQTLASGHVFDGMFTHVIIHPTTITVSLRLSAQDAAVVAVRSDLDRDGTLSISEAALQKIPIIAAFAESFVLRSDDTQLKPARGHVRVLNDDVMGGKAHELNLTLEYENRTGSPVGRIFIDPNLFRHMTLETGVKPRLSGNGTRNTVTIDDRGVFSTLNCSGQETYLTPIIVKSHGPTTN